MDTYRLRVMLRSDWLEKTVKSIMESGRKFWAFFLIVFMLLQAVNVFGYTIPDYADWNTFGFPFIYIQWQEGVGYTYFNILALLINALIIYVAIRGTMYIYLMITKFKIVEPPKK
ncbi:MAG: hypothetical protein JW789_00085 [Candidatus Aenigmarchaeota archaeon]|nr:hypothetical protein [Candidatus Aenigmarchaeota archaeon]